MLSEHVLIMIDCTNCKSCDGCDPYPCSDADCTACDVCNGCENMCDAAGSDDEQR